MGKYNSILAEVRLVATDVHPLPWTFTKVAEKEGNFAAVVMGLFKLGRPVLRMLARARAR
jgi:hypothetical protein